MRHLGTALAVVLVTLAVGTASAQPAQTVRALGRLNIPTDPRAEGPARADTITKPIQLSAEQVKSYLAVQHALYKYWSADSAHQALYGQAPATRARYYPSVMTGFEYPPIPGVAPGGVIAMGSLRGIDYAAVAKRDPAVAAIFTANHVAPEQWLDTKIAIGLAADWLTHLANNGDRPFPDSTRVFGKVLKQNMTVVEPHVRDIQAIAEEVTM